MLPLEVYQPDQWHDFFITVGGGAAALAGLVFVALSINLDTILHDSTHRNRAIGTLAGFTSVFMACAFALMGNQNHLSIGVEWAIISTVAGYIYVNGYVQAVRTGGDPAGLSPARLTIGMVCYAAEIAGSFVLIFGYIWGLYLAAGAMVLYFALMISGAWLLIVRAHIHSRRGQDNTR
jgi:hypothetical protein